MIKVSFGNRKLPKNTLIFNIPARATCPGRTALCSTACYALKAERLYKAVLPARQGNFEATREPYFALNMIEIIINYKHQIKQVRIHESGDFYNQKYLENWYTIARDFPGLIFYAYTKSFHLNFSKKPNNLILISSFDQTSRPEARFNYESKAKFFNNTFSMVDRHAPVTRATCPGDCRMCNRCWKGRGHNITVNQH